MTYTGLILFYSMPREVKCQGNEDIGGFGDSINRLKLSGGGCLTVSAVREFLSVVPFSLEVVAEPIHSKRGFDWLIGSHGA